MILRIFAGFLFLISFAETVNAANLSQYYSVNFWSGEYPRPVIKITADTKIPALRKIPFGGRPREKSIPCSVSKGVYHPWAKKTKATYLSVSAISVYEAKTAMTIEVEQDEIGRTKISLNPGDRVHQLAYYGGNLCLIEAKGHKGASYCPDDDEFKAIIRNNYYRQYLKVSCQEGYLAFISVTDGIFTIKGIERGNISEYGHVEE